MLCVISSGQRFSVPKPSFLYKLCLWDRERLRGKMNLTDTAGFPCLIVSDKQLMHAMRMNELHFH